MCIYTHTMSFSSGTRGKEPTCQFRGHKRRRSDPWVGKIPWRRAQQPTRVFCLENPMDRGASWPTVHGVSKSWTQLSAWHCHFTSHMWLINGVDHNLHEIRCEVSYGTVRTTCRKVSKIVFEWDGFWTLRKEILSPFHSVLMFIIAICPLLFSSFSGFTRHSMLYSFVDPLVFGGFFLITWPESIDQSDRFLYKPLSVLLVLFFWNLYNALYHQGIKILLWFVSCSSILLIFTILPKYLAYL